MCALENGYMKIAQLLLDAGANNCDGIDAQGISDEISIIPSLRPTA
jgi:hypothetical protein